MPSITFTDNQNKKCFNVEENGLSILEIARLKNIDIEGSCEGALACSTCHVKVSNKWIKKLNPPNIEELEMLGLVTNFERNSRLGCQVIFTKELDGIEIFLTENNNE